MYNTVCALHYLPHLYRSAFIIVLIDPLPISCWLIYKLRSPLLDLQNDIAFSQLNAINVEKLAQDEQQTAGLKEWGKKTIDKYVSRPTQLGSKLITYCNVISISSQDRWSIQILGDENQSERRNPKIITKDRGKAACMWSDSWAKKDNIEANEMSDFEQFHKGNVHLAPKSLPTCWFQHRIKLFYMPCAKQTEAADPRNEHWYL